MLRLHLVTKAYRKQPVVHDVSFDVAPGESLALLGPSGCGKTTILRLIAGLERPDAGDIWIDGRRVASHGRIRVPANERGVGLVFQDLALWPHLTVRENLAFVVGSTTTAKHERAEHIENALMTCQIDLRLADRYPHELSGGEQQRVALARALVGTPRLLMLDEPFSSVDSELRFVLRRQLASLQKQMRLTTIYVTHDSADAAALADRTLRMRHGRIESISDDRPAT
jgi:ABC-type Fe3+/spermidine/putrescine transport system ATPase subunit